MPELTKLSPTIPKQAMSSAEQVEMELKDYLRDKNINRVFISIVEHLLLSKPDNPIKFMIEYL
jgi:cAMP-dependent protein kinase regulator